MLNLGCDERTVIEMTSQYQTITRRQKIICINPEGDSDRTEEGSGIATEGN